MECSITSFDPLDVPHAVESPGLMDELIVVEPNPNPMLSTMKRIAISVLKLLSQPIAHLLHLFARHAHQGKSTTAETAGYQP